MTQSHEEIARKLIEGFNRFIEKWTGDSFPHLIDSDENDGERFREKIEEALDRLAAEKDADIKLQYEANEGLNALNGNLFKEIEALKAELQNAQALAWKKELAIRESEKELAALKSSPSPSGLNASVLREALEAIREDNVHVLGLDRECVHGCGELPKCVHDKAEEALKTATAPEGEKS